MVYNDNYSCTSHVDDNATSKWGYTETTESKWYILSLSELSLEEKIAWIEKEIKGMTEEERWGLIMESFGMWEDYPEDWLERMRRGEI